MKKLLVLLFIIPIISKAQENTKMYLHLNKDFYVSGENIMFNLFFYDNSQKSLSLSNKLLTCYLIESNGNSEKIVSKIKITLFNGTASGNIDLPTELTDGYYYLSVYTNNHHFVKDILIYESKNNKRVNFDLSNIAGSENKSQGYATLKTNKNSYSPREAIVLNINSLDSDKSPVFNQFSLSITQNQGVKKDVSSFEMVKMEGGLNFSNDLNGVVMSLDKTEIYRNHLIIAYALKNGKMLAGYSNDEGVVNISLDELNGEDYLYINAYDTKGKRSGEAYVEAAKEADPVAFLTGYNKKLYAPSRTDEIEMYIENYLKQKKINDSYFLNKEKERQIKTDYKGDFTVNLSEFQSMASIKDAIREITPRAILKENRKLGTDEIYLISWGEGKRFDETPLFLINGIPTLNGDSVMNIEYKNCKEFNVLTSNPKLKQFWQMGQNGVLAITLKSGVPNPFDGTLKNLTQISSIQHGKAFEGPDWSKESPVSSNNPNIRSTLFWNPNLFTRDGQLEFKIYAPDNLGKFAIELFGVNENGGIEFTRKTFEVNLNN